MAINNNKEELKKSSSGGMFYILSNYIFNNNGIVSEYRQGSNTISSNSQGGLIENADLQRVKVVYRKDAEGNIMDLGNNDILDIPLRNIFGCGVTLPLIGFGGVIGRGVFEATLSDMAIVEKADLFVYIGGESEEWVGEMFDSMGKSADKIKKLEKKLERVNYQFEEDRISQDEYDRKYKAIVEEMNTLRVEDNTPEVTERDLEPLRAFLRLDLDEVYKTLTREEKRALWRSVVSEIILHPDGRIDPRFF